MLARLVSGWPGKIMVLVLLGFAATGVRHHEDALGSRRGGPPCREPELAVEARRRAYNRPAQLIAVTMILLMLLGATFLRGFREVIGLAVMIVGIYLALNLIVIGYGIAYLIDHPEKWSAWVERLESGQVVPGPQPARGRVGVDRDHRRQPAAVPEARARAKRVRNGRRGGGSRPRSARTTTRRSRGGGLPTRASCFWPRQ